MAPGPEFLARPDGAQLAYERIAVPHAGTGRSGAAPGIVFLHGLMSDRGGTKAVALADHCRRRGYGLVRYDMFGHGQSSGRFEDGTISRWTADAVAVVDALTEGPQILIGSSMGGWVMVKAALARPARIAGLVGIAVGPDFTEDLMWDKFSPAARATLESRGVVEVPSDYDPRPYPISRALIEDGRANLILRGDLSIACPVRLLHGQQDSAVPWQTSLRLSEKMSGADVVVSLIKDGDHRLSRPQDLAMLCAALDDVVATVRP